MQRICVYCGSSLGRRSDYATSAKALGLEFVKRGITLIYGGASVGIMGLIADTMLNEGGEVVGVIPQSLAEMEVAHQGLSELKIVSNMHERKAMMADLSDGFIALPGGMGTLEELFETLTWSQLQFHNKPCGLLNVEGYYDQLLSFLDHTVDEQYLKPQHRELLLASDNANDLLEKLSSYQPAKGGKWIKSNEL